MSNCTCFCSHTCSCCKSAQALTHTHTQAHTHTHTQLQISNGGNDILNMLYKSRDSSHTHTHTHTHTHKLTHKHTHRHTNKHSHTNTQHTSVASFLVLWGGGGQDPQMYRQIKNVTYNARASASETYISQVSKYICTYNQCSSLLLLMALRCM